MISSYYKQFQRFLPKRLVGIITGAFILFFCACNKDTKAPALFPLETGALSSSKDTVVIDASWPGSEAVTISWKAFSNAMISYSMVLAYGNNKDTVAVPSGAVSRKFNYGELNNILVSNLGMKIDSLAQMSFTLLAKIPTKNDSTTSQSLKIWVKPAPTGAAYNQLWVVGDATPAGWNINNPSPMRKDPTNSFQFKFNEVLSAGDFKIPTSTGNWGTDFFMPIVNHPALTSTDVKLTIGGNPDNKWQITTPGAYKILLNISTLPFITITPFTPYTQLWMVGDAAPSGWNINAPTPMVATAGNPYEFTYTGPMNAGEFKIPVAVGNWSTSYFMPVNNDEGVNSTDAIFVPVGGIDNKWKITDAGNYKIVINQLYETISIKKQ